MKCLPGPTSPPATPCQAAQLRLRATRPLHVSRQVDHRLRAALVGEAAPRRLGFEPEQQFRATYDIGQLLGSGAEGEVFVATHRSTGEKRAVKKVKKRFLQDGTLSPAFAERVSNEVDVYHTLGRSLAVAHLYGAYEDDSHIFMVQELCTGGELWTHIDEAYSELTAAQIVRSIVQTLAQFHAHHIVWRDCKAENFIFANKDPDSPLKAVDFGTAVHCEPGAFLSAHAGSPVYAAPEVLRKKYSFAADIWSAGIITYMLLTARLPWHGNWGVGVADLYAGTAGFGRRDALEALLTFELDFESPDFTRLSEEAQDFVKNLLQRDPRKRLKADEALRHPWLQLESVQHAADQPLGPSIVQRLQRFHTYNTFKQAVFRGLVRQIKKQQAGVPADVHAEFAHLDPEGTGQASLASVRELLRGERFALSSAEVDRLVQQLGIADDSDVVRYDEWAAAMISWKTVEDAAVWDEWVESAFNEIDTDASGSLDSSELREFLCKDGSCLTPQAVEDAVRGLTAASEGMDMAAFKQLLSARAAHDDLHVFADRGN